MSKSELKSRDKTEELGQVFHNVIRLDWGALDKDSWILTTSA
jgi:hypothetical protein